MYVRYSTAKRLGGCIHAQLSYVLMYARPHSLLLECVAIQPPAFWFVLKTPPSIHIGCVCNVPERGGGNEKEDGTPEEALWKKKRWALLKKRSASYHYQAA